MIVGELTKRGVDENMPVAIIHRGTTALQRTVVGTLKNIVATVEREKVGAPSVIVVGKVVSLREKLAWFEKSPLFGKRILVTRTRRQASVLAEALRENGAFVSEFPTIEITPNEKAYPELDCSIKDLSGFNWVIFTSANGVEVFFNRMKFLRKDARAFANLNICAIGPATAEKLLEYGVAADLVPEKYIAESIAEALKGKVKGKKILLPRADIARAELAQLLEKDGATIKEIPIYKTTIPLGLSGELKDIVENTDMVTFTSSSTAENFAAILGCHEKEICGKIRAASIGPITTEAVKKAGIEIACEAREYTIPGLVEVILEYYREAGK
jgi:uroporphyrinogen III methyltransferase/synthase